MASYDTTGIPRCTVDYPLDITPDEIVTLSGAINTLLKSSYLLGSTFEIEATFNSLFDIAEEIGGAEACGLLYRMETIPIPGRSGSAATSSPSHPRKRSPS